MDEAKEAWISRVTREAELAKKNGKLRWTSIQKLQMAHVGIRPAQSATLYKRDGRVTSGPEEVKATWHQHFTKVLNIPSEYCQKVLDDMPSLPPVMELDHHPTSEELGEKMSKLKRGKAGGRTGILPELLLYGGAELQDRLLLLMDDVWKRGGG